MWVYWDLLLELVSETCNTSHFEQNSVATQPRAADRERLGRKKVFCVFKNKPMILCARCTSRSNEPARKTDYPARTCERFVYSLVKITRLCDYQTWQNIFGEIHEVRKVFFLSLDLYVSHANWLGRQLRSHSISPFLLQSPSGGVEVEWLV